MLRRAFTLIELLVVIAIIAILAAILFPVFAQAKTAAKKTAALSNTKQTGTSIILYTTDSDDVMPLAHPFRADGQMLSGPPSYRLAAVPAGWGGNAAFLNEDSVMWVNSTNPYRKSADLLDTQFDNTYTTGFDYSTSPGGLGVTHMTMNGLLNSFSATAVAAPSQLPLVFYGNGKESYRGYAYTSPYLRCRNTGPCMFNPGGMPQAGAFNSRGDTYEFAFDNKNDTTWVMGEGFVYAAVDSSAKYVKTPRTGLNTGSRTHPGYEYRNVVRGTQIEGGFVFDPARCVTGGADAPAYLSFFRPDSTFNYELGNTGMRRPCNNN